jgi:hypothetical protein
MSPAAAWRFSDEARAEATRLLGLAGFSAPDKALARLEERIGAELRAAAGFQDWLAGVRRITRQELAKLGEDWAGALLHDGWLVSAANPRAHERAWPTAWRNHDSKDVVALSRAEIARAVASRPICALAALAEPLAEFEAESASKWQAVVLNAYAPDVPTRDDLAAARRVAEWASEALLRARPPSRQGRRFAEPFYAEAARSFLRALFREEGLQMKGGSPRSSGVKLFALTFAAMTGRRLKPDAAFDYLTRRPKRRQRPKRLRR